MFKGENEGEVTQVPLIELQFKTKLFYKIFTLMKLGLIIFGIKNIIGLITFYLFLL